MRKKATCAGENCTRREDCQRHQECEVHDVQQLCYSGFTFFESIECNEDDD